MKTILDQLKKEIKFEIVEVTPEMAEQYLATSKGNRNIKQDTIKSLVSELQAGKWCVNGETIVLDENKALLDGHHRLEAIHKSGVSAICIFVKGIKRATWTTMDSGCARSLSDVFKIAGILNSSSVSVAVAGTIAKINTTSNGVNTLGSGNTLKRSGRDRKYALDFYYKNADSFQSSVSIAKTIHRKLPCFTVKEISIISAFLVVDKLYSINQVSEFWNLVVNGNDMFASMRSVFINDAQEMRFKKMSYESRHSYIATIWNYYIQKNYVKKVRYAMGEHVDFI